MSEEKHWPAQRMQEEGYADYMTVEDVEKADDDTLAVLATLCAVDEMQPNECMSCLALAVKSERAHQEAIDHLAAGQPVEEVATDYESYETPFEEEQEVSTPKLDALMSEPDVFEPVPVADQFHAKVQELALLAEQMLAGPPIPPPNVSLEDLATLVLGSKRWLAMVEAQGAQFAPDQEAVRQRIQQVVSRLSS